MNDDGFLESGSNRPDSSGSLFGGASSGEPVLSEGGGFVSIVGAGPGDPELLTLLARRRLSEADVILFDRLVDPETLVHARDGALLVDVGKQEGAGAEQQARIIELMLEHARAGKRVVRLKGGDPLVFGRGSEEASALSEANIPFEIVPGVSSALAGPASAGIPLTHREMARGFAVVTGRAASGEVPSDDEVDWGALASFRGTLVFLMAVTTLSTVTSRLVEAGADPATPAALIQDATLSSQRVLVSTLGTVAEDAKLEGIGSPAVLVIGEVVTLRDRLEWRSRLPLLGKTVVVTRPVERASSLAAALRDLGAGVVLAPSMSIQPIEDPAALEDAVERLMGGGFSWVVFTSRTGVEALFASLSRAGGDARAFAGTKVAALGGATAAALAECGLRADFVPRRSTASGLGHELPMAYRAEPVLAVQPVGGRPELALVLRERGFDVEVAEAYRTVKPAADDPSVRRVRELLEERSADAVLFASGSQVENFVELFGVELLPPARICIGPTTAEALKSAGVEPTAVAREQSVGGLVRALLEAVGKQA